MVRVKESDYYESDGSINIDAWLDKVKENLSTEQLRQLQQACVLSQLTGEHMPTPSGLSCLHQGLAIAEMLLDIQQDQTCASAAILYYLVIYAELSLDIVREQFGDDIASLIGGVKRMQAISSLQSLTHGYSHAENVRMMLLAMVEDVRVVLIKLAEQVITLRNAPLLGPEQRRNMAKETLDIYAPLANRLGVYQIKWELEDLAFRHTEPEVYKSIASMLDERRLDREAYVVDIVNKLKSMLAGNDIEKYEVYGRVKHIYSIYRKMKRKRVGYESIYDTTAVRVLVPTLEDTYTVLSIVHSLWEQIPEEFDDYITTPKPNGYRSIHTAVIGPGGKNIEVQIRTFDMHAECEIGVAAHWVYKEGKPQKTGYEAKITWLRQVLEWQKELANVDQALDDTHAEIFDDRVYVFTPKGQVLDLKNGATPLDFAYHVHTEVGHRCRGAKVNGNIVPLTYRLKTADRVEILTTKHPHPSRDWLNPHLGYLRTPRAKAKVHHWFKLQDHSKNLETGASLLEQECKRLGIANIKVDDIASRFNFKSGKDLLAALGCGDLRLAQVIGAWRALHKEEGQQDDEVPLIHKPLKARPKALSSDISIHGVDNLLTHFAKCCNPVPGDPIIGYITINKGVSIHLTECKNILSATDKQRERLIEVEWGQNQSRAYQVVLQICAYDRPGLLRDITNLLSTERINLLSLNTSTDKLENTGYVTIAIEISDLEMLSRLYDRLMQINNVFDVKRTS